MPKVNILLVDDNPANLIALTAVLDRPDYHLVLANSGKEALNLVHEREFAVVLLDVQMPEMDGFETARRLRALPSGKETPIIFVTAIFRETKFVQDGYSAGGVDYLFKPLDSEMVKSKVAVFVDLFLKTKTLRRLQERTARLVAVQRITTDLLASANDPEQVIPSLLREICKTLDWDLGTFWAPDTGETVLRCRQFWSDPACPASFISSTAQEEFRPGVGLPGRVWLNSRSLWAKEGKGSALAFPIPAGGQVKGVMEFFSREPQLEDIDLLRIMTAVGNQIGQYLARVEALRVAQEAVKAREEFISIASHELRSPLAVLKMQAQFNRSRFERGTAGTITPDMMAKFFKVNVDQIDRMHRLVETMLDLSRISHGHFSISRERFDLAELIASVAEMLDDQASSRKCRISLSLASNVVGDWDRSRLEQVITNLVMNAIKYGAAGEIIEIIMTADTDGARVSVRDHGPGIQPSDLGRIFDRFERGGNRDHVGGLGLGLYISRQIARAHGGDLRVESQPGQGATFTVELPFRVADRASSEGSSSSAVGAKT